MWYRVVWDIFNDISEEWSASIFRLEVAEISKERDAYIFRDLFSVPIGSLRLLARLSVSLYPHHIIPFWAYSSTPKMEAASSSVASVDIRLHNVKAQKASNPKITWFAFVA
jgi:hypothetical protein